ncbi:hypothetical protein Q3A80_06105 [Burkholderia sp. SR8]|uniref:hypothetical protein n=1 Tax=Burkholderia sp. SR8 TaxID=3062277 RepID=UPI004062D20D
MTRLFLLTLGLIASLNAFGASVVASPSSDKLATDAIDPKIAEQCGMSIRTPRLKNIYGQPLGFGCTGSYRNGKHAGMDMDFQYDPNENAGGERVEFDIQSTGIENKINSGGDSLFKKNENNATPTLSSGATFAGSNCGPVKNVVVTPISGDNWHGWIAEGFFGKAPRGCKLMKEYTTAYRCVSMMIGNEKMVAQLGGVCLLRKKEYGLENGLSYDIFMDMIKSIHFADQ